MKTQFSRNLKGFFTSRSLKHVVRRRIAESILLAAVLSGLGIYSVVSSQSWQALLLGMLLCSNAGQAAGDAVSKIRALRNPLFYLAAAEHDLGTPQKGTQS